MRYSVTNLVIGRKPTQEIADEPEHAVFLVVSRMSSILGNEDVMITAGRLDGRTTVSWKDEDGKKREVILNTVDSVRTVQEENARLMALGGPDAP